MLTRRSRPAKTEVVDLHGDRSVGILKNEPREYGACNFEIAGGPK